RSQMSEAFARMIGEGQIEAYSAGSKPSGKINPRAIVLMRELGYNMSMHRSKSLDEVNAFAPFTVIVTMDCGDACPWMPAEKNIDWQIPDPRNMNEKEFREVRDLIVLKVKELLSHYINKS